MLCQRYAERARHIAATAPWRLAGCLRPSAFIDDAAFAPPRCHTLVATRHHIIDAMLLILRCAIIYLYVAIILMAFNKITCYYAMLFAVCCAIRQAAR